MNKLGIEKGFLWTKRRKNKEGTELCTGAEEGLNTFFVSTNVYEIGFLFPMCLSLFLRTSFVFLSF